MPSVSCRNVQNGSGWALRKHGVSVWPDLFSSLRKPALIDARTNCSVAGFAIGEWFGHDERTVEMMVHSGSSIFEQSEARDGRASQLLERKSGPPGTRTRNKRFKRPLL